jgi:hypothetical protein
MDPQKFPDLSIDIETLGVSANAVIIQIGVVEFNTDTVSIGDSFVLYPGLREQYEDRRVVDVDTIKWWTKTDPALFGNILNSKTSSRSEVRTRMIDVMTPARSYWFKHPMFDMSILNSAYDLGPRLRVLDPRSYRKIKDISTLAPALGVPEPEFVGSVHDALSDALHQAKWVIECFSKIQGWS